LQLKFCAGFAYKIDDKRSYALQIKLKASLFYDKSCEIYKKFSRCEVASANQTKR